MICVKGFTVKRNTGKANIKGEYYATVPQNI